MITKERALQAIENMDDYARMANIDPVGAYSTLLLYVEQMESKVFDMQLVIESQRNNLNSLGKMNRSGLALFENLQKNI